MSLPKYTAISLEEEANVISTFPTILRHSIFFQQNYRCFQALTILSKTQQEQIATWLTKDPFAYIQ